MVRKIILVLFVSFVFVGVYFVQNARHVDVVERSTKASAVKKKEEAKPYQRIVSLAPSITETLYALGLGKQVVGVTRYCKYPKDALTKEKIGGFYDVNYEAIALLKPDLVVLFPQHEKARKQLEILGIHILEVDHGSVAGVLDSIRIIATACHKQANAFKIMKAIHRTLDKVRIAIKDLPRPRVLLSIGRDISAKKIKSICIAGTEGFYSKLIELAGGVNVYHGNVSFPMISGEGIIKLNPEIVIDVVATTDMQKTNVPTLLKEWQSVPNIDAVKNHRVYVLQNDYMVIPGPRFIHILEAFVKVIHPNIDWK